MSKIARMMQQATAGAGGAGLDVDEVFSTHLYEGGSNPVTITNNIDLSGEGGLVWIKSRTDSSNHNLEDTVRGAGKSLNANNTNAEENQSGSFGIDNSGGFLSNGFKLIGLGSRTNAANQDYVSWTFRKAPKFFDVVTYSGAAYVDQTINHNLGSVPGMIIIKCLSSRKWVVYHRSLGNTKHLHLNTTDAESTVNYFNNTDPTATTFTVEGGDSDVNGYTLNYVAYLFAHNNNDGEFGPDSDQDIIKCGSYTGGGNTDVDVNLGFEPQFLLIKNATDPYNWVIFDTMRGIPVDGSGPWLVANSNSSESYDTGIIKVTSTGFTIMGNQGFIGENGDTYIYMAIRRGPLAAPTAGTQVFAMDSGSSSSPAFTAGFPVDMAFKRHRTATDNWRTTARLIQGSNHFTNTTGADEVTASQMFDYQNGYYDDSQSSANQAWMWKRAPSYFDVIAWTGTGNNMNISHNLGVVPEMIWARPRSYADHWSVFHKDLTYNLKLDNSSAMGGGQVFGTLTSSVMPTASGSIHASGHTYIAYLFATAAGVSKVGSYTGTGSAQNIDCGFSNGARFVLIKRYDSTSAWFVFDTVRGIVAGNDPVLNLNGTGVEETSDDMVDPYSSGFSVTSNASVNTNNGTYIFYAIA